MRTTMTMTILALAAALMVSDAQASVVARKGVAGYFSADDNFNHAVIGKANGELWEAWWQSGGGEAGAIRLTTAWWDPNITQVAGFYSPDEGVRHDVFVTSNKNIWDYSYVVGGWSSLDLIGTAPSGVSIAAIDAYYTADGFYHYAIAANAPYGNARIYVYRYHPFIGGSGRWHDMAPRGGSLARPASMITAWSERDYRGTKECFFVDQSGAGNSWSLYYDFTKWCFITSATPPDFTDYSKVLEYEYRLPRGLGAVVGAVAVPSGGVEVVPELTWATAYDWGRSRYNTQYGYQGASIYHFWYGPSVRAYGAFREPGVDTIHGLTAMSSGELWDMRVPSAGGPVTWTLLGSY